MDWARAVLWTPGTRVASCHRGYAVSLRSTRRLRSHLKEHEIELVEDLRVGEV
jgi:hypothetical protein